MQAIQIPALPDREVHYWTLPPPCGSCKSCLTRRRIEFAVTYMDAHFARTIERLDGTLPNYLHLVDRLVAERDLEVGKMRRNMPYCDKPVIIEAS